jgi:hypothetical protein
MNAMKNEIARLSNSLIDEKKKDPKRSEFESHTKVFGSRYMKKFGFVDGKGLVRKSKAQRTLSHSSRKTRLEVWAQRMWCTTRSNWVPKAMTSKSSITLLSSSRVLKMHHIPHKQKQRLFRQSQTRSRSHMHLKTIYLPIMC